MEAKTEYAEVTQGDGLTLWEPSAAPKKKRVKRAGIRITVSRALLVKAKHAAIDQGLSFSRYIEELLGKP